MIRTWPYVVVAMCLAAIAAGLMVGLEFGAFIWLASAVESRPTDGLIAYAAFAAIVAAPAFLIGLVFPGLPVWLWLHGVGRRSYATAAMAVAVGASAAGVILSASSGPWALVNVAWLAAPGAVAGLVLRWVAYSSKPPPARPS